MIPSCLHSSWALLLLTYRDRIFLAKTVFALKKIPSLCHLSALYELRQSLQTRALSLPSLFCETGPTMTQQQKHLTSKHSLRPVGLQLWQRVRHPVPPLPRLLLLFTSSAGVPRSATQSNRKLKKGKFHGQWRNYFFWLLSNDDLTLHCQVHFRICRLTVSGSLQASSLTSHLALTSCVFRLCKLFQRVPNGKFLALPLNTSAIRLCIFHTTSLSAFSYQR